MWYITHMDGKESIKCDANTFIATTKEGDDWCHKNKNKALAKALGFLVDTPERTW